MRSVMALSRGRLRLMLPLLYLTREELRLFLQPDGRHPHGLGSFGPTSAGQRGAHVYSS
jgi:hypothetical protein